LPVVNKNISQEMWLWARLIPDVRKKGFVEFKRSSRSAVFGCVFGDKYGCFMMLGLT
jgi:hypothetical protein